MKLRANIILLTIIASLNYSSAAIIEIRAIGLAGQPQSYSPANPTVIVGDTIRWLNQNGTHTSASTTIPAGAAAWNGNIPTDGVGYFEYVVTVAGTYNYLCHINLGGGAGHGMNGSFDAISGATSITTINEYSISNAYPVPFSNKLTIETNDIDLLILYNINGVILKRVSIPNSITKTEIETTELSSGAYVYSTFKEGKLLETKKLFKN